MRKIYFLSLLIACSFAAQAQQTAALTQVALYKWAPADTIRKPFCIHTTMATLAVGFADAYRSGYSYPAGFAKNNITGFVPVSGRIEYGVSSKVSIGVAFLYDAFTNNYYQQYQGNGKSFLRNQTDKVSILGAGLSAYYHLGDIVRVKRLDPFIGVGVMLNNYQQTAFPQGDSTTSRTEHPVTASLRIGARYYISNRAGLYADLGYEKQSLVNIGFSCRFFKK